MSLFAVKPLGSILKDAEQSSLKRTLGPTQLVALGIGAIIGAGLFSLTGIAASQNAGPAVVLSFVIAAVRGAVSGVLSSGFSPTVSSRGGAAPCSSPAHGALLA